METTEETPTTYRTELNPATCNSCGSRGLGDTIAAAIAVVGLDQLANMYKKITGKDCNCKTRQEALNKLMPYELKGTPDTIDQK